MYSKADQLKNNKVKVKKVGMFEKKHKMKYKRVATDEDLIYFQWLRSEFRACVVPECSNTDIDFHHLKFNETDTLHSSSARKNHKLVVSVCKQHHDKSDCSFHKGKKEMAKIFTKESLTIIASKYYTQFLESSFNDQDDKIELVYEETL